MDTYTVTFFGHRELSDPFVVEERLEPILHDLICNKDYVEFLIGRDEEFDLLVSSAIKRVVKDYGYSNTALVLVLPYYRAEYTRNKESFEEYYDEIEKIPDSELSYEMIMFLAECYHQLATKDHDGTFPLREHEQGLLIRAARLLRMVDKRGYHDHNWCGLLGLILQHVDCCQNAAYQLIERSLWLDPKMPKELLLNCYDEDMQ